MEVLVDAGSDGGGAPAFHCDPDLIKAYLLDVAGVLLGANSDGESEVARAAIATAEATDACRSFANDGGFPVLYMMKEIEGDSGEQPGYARPTASFALAFELCWKPTHAGSIALIKRTPTIDPHLPLASQTQVMNLPGPAAGSALPVAEQGKERAAMGASPYEALHAYVRFAVSPYFNAYVAAKERAEQQTAHAGGESAGGFRDDKDAQQGVPMAKKKLAELELSLLHLQQNVDIPDTVLNIHPMIAHTVEGCRRQGQRATVDAVDAALLADSGFLNQLQGDVNGWIKEIQKVTKLDRDAASGTASQEINFWLSMERALERIEEQLQSDEIVLTMDVLKAAKRFHATVSFRTDTGLKEAAERVTRYNVLMKDFPINELLSATDIGRIGHAIELVFAHVNKKLKLTAYPVRRALPLVEAISRDFYGQLVKVLGHVRLMHMEYAVFDSLFGEAQGAFDVWEAQVKEFANLARDITRRRGEKFIPIKIRAAHAPLQERISFVRQFRQQHEQLQQTIVRVMGSADGEEGTMGDASAIGEIGQAYDVVRSVDILDVTAEGTDAWERAETGYNERVARVENQIIARLRDRLATARNASEMFRVFSKFNALFVRPKIRGAIQEYQTQLISSVKEDIRRLHDKFKRHYRRSEAYAMSQLRDVPPVSGAIIWIRQIEHQLDMYMRRVEDVLGRGWELYAEGQRLQADSASFRRKLDTRPLYDAWFAEISRRDLTVVGRVFLVTRHRATGGAFQLGVCFDAQLITLFKEVRELLWLGFQVPHTLVNMARDGRRVYPFAVSLMETAKIYRQTSHRLQQHPEVLSLAAGYRRDVMVSIHKGMALKWQYFVTSATLYAGSSVAAMGAAAAGLDAHENRNASFVREFAAVVALFQEKVETLIALSGEIDGAVRELATCAYAEENFCAILDRIQALIDRLNLDSYANLEQWVAALDARLEQVLAARLTQALQVWIREFNRARAQGDESDAETAEGRHRADESEAVPQLRQLVHELRIRNQVMYLDPPLENARASWVQQLHGWLAAVCCQRRPQAARYEVTAGGGSGGGGSGSGDADDADYDNLVLEYDPGRKAGAAPAARAGRSTYRDLLSRLHGGGVREAYESIEQMTGQAAAYVQIWLQYQALWDLQMDHVTQFLGQDLMRWQTMLLEIKRARATFDTSETAHYIGAHCVVDYEQVQGKVNAKYDNWQREILGRFGQQLGEAMRSASQAIAAARRQLETHSAEASTTSEVVAFVTYVQELRRKCPGWRRDVEEVFRGGQRVLEKQRYQFPAEWVFLDQVEGEWSAFNEILARKANVIQEQLPSLQLKLVAEDRAVEARIGDVCADWARSKPVQGSLRPDEATAALAAFQQRLTRLAEESAQVHRAKEALGMDGVADERLAPLLEEVTDLRGVWTALSGIWAAVTELRETPWASVVVRKVRQQLDRQLAEAKQLPNRMRQYAAFEHMQKTLRALLKAGSVVADLKSDALRDRHWRQMFKALRVSHVMADLTLGDVWDLDIERNETAIRDVITVAQGEMALEEFLGQVRETWSGYVLELVGYQGKCRLIRGWDELFAKCAEQLSALSAMRGSPYYKVFEEEAGAWEDKLNRIHVLFDVWVDVQRQWVYLEGIFAGSADIKHLLPVESARFQNINTEFLAVMKKVYKSPYVLDVLGLPNVQRSLERLADLLEKIQKALGEYLERERSSFPRFYFVGDEDLLEIIGNARDVPRIQKHLGKMFAGLTFIQLSDDGALVLGMASKDGEHVPFRQPVELSQHARINDWLAAIEREMRLTLATRLGEAVAQLEAAEAEASKSAAAECLREWVAATPAQLVVLAKQVVWTRRVEAALQVDADGALAREVAALEAELHVLADAVLEELPPLVRKKTEHLITELVHQRDVARQLATSGSAGAQDFAWLSQMRFSYAPQAADPLQSVTVRIADAEFHYGFEYLGVPERLVQTPLTDRCYLTLTQALAQRLGGSPFGPAGTGKTESVKALATQLGRFSLVFCCDETFDFKAMGRIFVGLCQVGAWGVFDEFNRLDERILSAVSQQIQTIQLGLRRAYETSSDRPAEIELLEQRVRLSQDTGIFITMNPGYAGRSNLPDNLKKLFRSFAMTRPDRGLIAQVMLYSQGFRQAELLARKVVPLFNLCAEQLSTQAHYDFGLRALKSVLVSAGNLKRDSRLQQQQQQQLQPADEQSLVIQSIRETVVPKLVSADIQLLARLLDDVFPGAECRPASATQLREAVAAECAARNMVAGDQWVEKVVQLYQIQAIHHGVMLVGDAGCGKTAAWQVLLAALERVEGVEGVSHVIDPKAVPKDELYGTLDPTTREWRDGLFTHLLRKIIDSVRGESGRRHWIVFDGDVDPEWVENLNSVLDDNRLLTLPNGERLALPSNVRVLFEVETLRYATPATVSRCGMVWFGAGTVTFDMAAQHFLRSLCATAATGDAAQDVALDTHTQAAAALEPHLAADGLVARALGQAEELDHIMEFTRPRALGTLFALVGAAVRELAEYNAQHADFPLAADAVEAFMAMRLAVAVVWSFAGDAPAAGRRALSDFVCGAAPAAIAADMPVATGGDGTDDGDGGETLLDVDVELRGGAATWVRWAQRVPRVDVEPHRVADADVVVPTADTLRLESVLGAWVAERRPVMLCGPPGSGKTMTLLAALRQLADVEVAALNFSSATGPDLVRRALEQHCEYRRTPGGTVLAPSVPGRWLVVFCDEINLPAADTYGTQRVIAFVRGLVERGGFWRGTRWVALERVQFVGACNPPTDPGRVALSRRFLRHAPVVLVDYPGVPALRLIYGALVRAMLKVQPALGAYAEPLTWAMVEVYSASQRRFTPDQQAHYVYSPRELTRWTRGLYAALRPREDVGAEELVRLWAHEALRLFQDRLVDARERRWTDECIDAVARRHFPTADLGRALARPLLFSSWLTRNYDAVGLEELREYTRARLRVFCEEELDVPLVLFDDVLDHVLRIDRVFRQPQGHALLIGASGAGKTTLARFAAWMNGLAVFEVRAHRGYGAAAFDDDLRAVLRRAGCGGEKLCFVLDESNVLDAAFLERMNTLLANAEVPGLFEGDERAALLTACRDGAQRDGLLLDSDEELLRWFSQQVARNLHVVFTMNPPAGGLATRAATSPALFNRCVVDWFGDWSDQALFQVGRELTQPLDLDVPGFVAPDTLPVAYAALELPADHRATVVNALVAVHKAARGVSARLVRRRGQTAHVTPRHFVDFLGHAARLYYARREQLEEQQRHVNVGLDKLLATVTQVEELRASLGATQAALEAKTREADAKLQQMVRDQQEAEQQRAESEVLRAEVQSKDAAIEARRVEAMRDLERAEPAVEEAQRAVSGIKKQHLSEVRAMANPPAAVKLALESVCVLLGQRQTDWKALQGVVRRDDFIASIVNFDADRHLPRALRTHVRRTYLERPEFNFETVNRASKACGPLAKWVTAQVEYAEILERVAPLRSEVAQLERDADATKARAAELAQAIGALEASIARYKDDYARLIAETERLRGEMARVEAKVARSLRLLSSLESERARWEESSRAFAAQMSTLVGDIVVGGALLAYGGAYDQHYRTLVVRRWLVQCERSGISVNADERVGDLVSSAEERLAWQAHGLPDDALAMENAAMLAHFRRFPLVVDPSGTAARFIEQLEGAAGRRLTVTSFLDAAFLKQLEAALRFGNAILIHDAEHVDPILNPVLNRELRRTGGRVLVRLGTQDVDFSPAFRMYLATRDPAAALPADLASRVTLVSFTVTRASLQAQCLGQVMRHERPDVDSRRRGLLRLQGELRLRLHELEKQLLQALNASRGSVLDDDSVVASLETLKAEAAEVARKAAETDGVMREVDRVAAVFTPLARACAAVYFALERLSALHPFYQFSLGFFDAIFREVVERNAHLDGVSDEAQRLRIVRRDLFALTFRRAAAALHHDRQLPLLLLLAQIKLRGDEDENEDEAAVGGPARASQEAWARLNADLDFVLRDAAPAAAQLAAPAEVPAALDALVSGDARAGMAAHAQALGWCRAWVRALRDDDGDASEWLEFLRSSDPERCVPRAAVLADGGAVAELAAAVALRELVVVRVLRPDRVLAAAARLAAAVFGGDSARPLEAVGLVAEASLGGVAKEVDAATPVALCAVPGHDAAYRVDALAAAEQRSMRAVAMGSAEGEKLADQAIAAAAKAGAWVLLKNVHLAPAWLERLEKRLETLRAHGQFRLFLTMEINPAVPASLLRRARTLLYEPATGLRANLLESLRTTGAGGQPAERARLRFLLAWLHAVVVERLRYAPLGWAHRYEFSDADFACALATGDGWLARAAQGRANVAPERIPWDAIRGLLVESVYGGRIDSVFDHRVLAAFVSRWFCADAYGADFALVDEPCLRAPEGTSAEDFERWCLALPETQPPTWLGLPPNAETLLLVQKGQQLVADVRKLRALMDDDEEEEEEECAGVEDAQPASREQDDGGIDDRAELPAFMRQVAALAAGFAQVLPESLPALSTAGGGGGSQAATPLLRVMERENGEARALLARVREDLAQLGEVCCGRRKQTNHLRQLLADFNAGAVPSAWLSTYVVPRGLSLSQWVADFGLRLAQGRELVGAYDRGAEDAIQNSPVWLGGLLYPEAFITATRQAVAKQLACSLEELHIGLVLGDGPADHAFRVRGLRLEGAEWTRAGLALNDGRSGPLPACLLTWARGEPGPAAAAAAAIPVYLNSDRLGLLFEARLPTGGGAQSAAAVVERAVAITAG